jgi:hypothetical protein
MRWKTYIKYFVAYLDLPSVSKCGHVTVSLHGKLILFSSYFNLGDLEFALKVTTMRKGSHMHEIPYITSFVWSSK